MRRHHWLIGMIAASALIAGGLLSWQWQTGSQHQTGTGFASFPAQLVMPDLDDQPQAFTQWRGRLVLINFWATWCPPCREEIPLFMALRNNYGAQGFEVVGIAIDDNEKVRDYRDELFIDYPLLQGERQTVQLMQTLGNRMGVLPYSVLFGRDGKMLGTKNGAFEHDELERLIREHL